MTPEEEYILKEDLFWHKQSLNSLKPKIVEYGRMCTIAIILSFIYGVVAGALIF